jgi:F0F1-type ATP synthase assembly protein I
MKPGGDPSPWRALGSLAQVGMTFVVSTVLGLAGGYWADRWLGTGPWLLLLGLGFGIAAGFVNLFRSLRIAERLDRTDRG